MFSLLSHSCAHTENPSLLFSGVFKLAVLVMAQCPCSAFTQAGNPPAFHEVPVSSPELSCIFPCIHERVNEFPSLLAKNWRSVWPSSEKVFRDLKGKGNYKRLSRHMVIVSVGNLAGPGQSQVLLPVLTLLGSVKLMGEMQLGFQ